MDTYEVVPDGAGTFSVNVRFHSGHRETKRGFETKEEAETWAEAQLAKAGTILQKPWRP